MGLVQNLTMGISFSVIWSMPNIIPQHGLPLYVVLCPNELVSQAIVRLDLYRFLLHSRHCMHVLLQSSISLCFPVDDCLLDLKFGL